MIKVAEDCKTVDVESDISEEGDFVDNFKDTGVNILGYIELISHEWDEINRGRMDDGYQSYHYPNYIPSERFEEKDLIELVGLGILVNGEGSIEEYAKAANILFINEKEFYKNVIDISGIAVLMLHSALNGTLEMTDKEQWDYSDYLKHGGYDDRGTANDRYIYLDELDRHKRKDIGAEYMLDDDRSIAEKETLDYIYSSLDIQTKCKYMIYYDTCREYMFGGSPERYIQIINGIGIKQYVATKKDKSRWSRFMQFMREMKRFAIDLMRLHPFDIVHDKTGTQIRHLVFRRLREINMHRLDKAIYGGVCYFQRPKKETGFSDKFLVFIINSHWVRNVWTNTMEEPLPQGIEGVSFRVYKRGK